MKCKWWIFTDMQMAKKSITEKKYNYSSVNIWVACSESDAGQSRISH